MNNEMLRNPAVTLEDIVFESRNKEYGSYVLRKKFRKYLTIAFLITVTVAFTLILIPFIKALNSKEKGVVLMQNTVATMEKVDNNDIPPPPPPPPPPPAAVEQQVKYVAPVVVDSVKEEVQLAIVSDAVETTVNEAPPEKVEVVAPQEEAIVEEEQVFIIVEEPASFQGGDVNQFRKWVESNLVYPTIAAENGVSGKVFVQFAVNSKGEVVDVKVVRGVDASLDKESIRVIMSSPKWTPAKQGGKAVKQQFTIPLSFVLRNG
jgi:periplasmic protein TonB